MVPCMIRQDMVMDEVDGQWRTYCSEGCHWTDKVAFRPTYQGRETPNMGKLVGTREWETLYHGWKYGDIIKDCGYVRDDGKTLVAQPHLSLDPKDMWTLDHFKKVPPMPSPMVQLNEMTDSERELWAEDYRRCGPAGRYAEPAVAGAKRTY